jgi:hypothetical protein
MQNLNEVKQSHCSSEIKLTKYIPPNALVCKIFWWDVGSRLIILICDGIMLSQDKLCEDGVSIKG